MKEALMAWTVCIHRCGDGMLYTGCTNDIPGWQVSLQKLSVWAERLELPAMSAETRKEKSDP